MQFLKMASGKKKLQISRKEWEKIGKIAGFMDTPDDYSGRKSYDTEVVIDGKPVPVRVGYDARPGYNAPRESLGQPLGEDEPAGIEIVDIWGVDPSNPNQTGDSVMDLLGTAQIETLRREIMTSGAN